MKINLKQASEILDESEDMVMFYNQCGRIQATVDQDTMAWEFLFDDVIKLKSAIDEENKEKESAVEEGEQ